MPSGAHQIAHTTLMSAVLGTLAQLSGRFDLTDLGCRLLGSKSRQALPPSNSIDLIITLAYQLDDNPDLLKQGDACICPDDSDWPTIVIEAGDSESLSQLHIDAKRWLESQLVDVSLCVSWPPTFLTSFY
jgi:hypothetical protein